MLLRKIATIACLTLGSFAMTARSFNGQVTGHVYLTHDRPLAEVEQDAASILQP